MKGLRWVFSPWWVPVLLYVGYMLGFGALFLVLERPDKGLLTAVVIVFIQLGRVREWVSTETCG